MRKKFAVFIMMGFAVMCYSCKQKEVYQEPIKAVYTGEKPIQLSDNMYQIIVYKVVDNEIEKDSAYKTVVEKTFFENCEANIEANREWPVDIELTRFQGIYTTTINGAMLGVVYSKPKQFVNQWNRAFVEYGTKKAMGIDECIMNNDIIKGTIVAYSYDNLDNQIQEYPIAEEIALK